MAGPDTLAIHATAVAIDGAALVLTGPSGSGKSDLALRLIDAGAALIADDRVEFLPVNAQLCCRLPAEAPETVRGRMEIRGLGIVAVRSLAGPVPVQWLVDLVAAEAVERMPAPEQREILGHRIPLLRLAAFAASTVALSLARSANAGWLISAVIGTATASESASAVAPARNARRELCSIVFIVASFADQNRFGFCWIAVWTSLSSRMRTSASSLA